MSTKSEFYSGLQQASKGLVEYTLELVAAEEAGALAEESARPPRLLYAEDHFTHVEIKSVELPGVEVTPARRWVYVENGVAVPLGAWEERVWLEETEDGQEVPLGAGGILEWARERAGRLAGSDRALGAVMPVVMVGLPLLAWLGGDVQFAYDLARLTTLVLGPAAALWQLT